MTRVLPTGWEEKSLGEIATIKGGKRVPKGHKLVTYDTGHPYIRVADFNSKGSVDLSDIHFIEDAVYRQISRYTISSRDLYISIAGTIGKSGIIPPELEGANLTENACKLILNPTVSQKFLYYFTLTSLFLSQTIEQTKVAGQPKLALARLASIKLIVPSLLEQKRIVKKLDKIFADIDKAKENTTKNLQNAKEVFESYLEEVFTADPSSWTKKKLSEISELKQSKEEAKQVLKENDLVSFVPMEFLGIGKKYFNSDEKQMLKDVIKNYTYFAENDLIIAKITPCFENGKIGIAKDLSNGVGFGSSEYMVIRPNKEVSVEYLYYFFNRQSFRKEGTLNMRGAVGHKRVAKEFIEDYIVSYPNIERQEEIVQQLDKLQEYIEQLEQIYTKRLADLDELKQSVLQQAFSGKL